MIVALVLIAVVVVLIRRLWRVGVNAKVETKNGASVAELMIEATRANEPRWRFAAYFTVRRFA
jgi:hypothetical protein